MSAVATSASVLTAVSVYDVDRTAEVAHEGVGRAGKGGSLPAPTSASPGATLAQRGSRDPTGAVHDEGGAGIGLAQEAAQDGLDALGVVLPE